MGVVFVLYPLVALSSFYTRSGTGFEAYFNESSNLVIGTATKKEFHTYTLHQTNFRTSEWVHTMYHTVIYLHFMYLCLSICPYIAIHPPIYHVYHVSELHLSLPPSLPLLPSLPLPPSPSLPSPYSTASVSLTAPPRSGASRRYVSTSMAIWWATAT